MKILQMLFVVLITVSGTLKAGTGEAGSGMESFQLRVLSIDLIATDDVLHNIYNGSSYLEAAGKGVNTVVSALAGTFPAEGEYKGLVITADSFRIKAKLLIDGTAYYSIDENLIQGEAWHLSTNAAVYAPTVIATDGTMQIETYFSNPLAVSAGNPVELGWVLQRSDAISYDGNLSEGITWLQQDDIVRAFTPAIPDKYVQFDLKTSNNEINTLTLLLNEGGNLLGGFSYRRDPYAVNASFMSAGTLVSDDNGVSGSFSLTFPDSDDNSQPEIVVTGQYNCDLGKFMISGVTPEVPNLITAPSEDLICQP